MNATLPTSKISLQINRITPEYAGILTCIIKTRIGERCPITFSNEGESFPILLEIDPKIDQQSFRIADNRSGIYIQGGDAIGLLFGVGKFLHTSQYTKSGMIPSDWRGTSTPKGTVRGIYFATHFFNWYHVAPEEELHRYIEDLSLWGINTIMIAAPLINLNGWNDPETDKSFEQMRCIFRSAKRLGLKAGIFHCPNQDFKTPRAEFKAVPNPDPLGKRGNNGNNVCPNKPGATEYLLDNFTQELTRFSGIDLDYLVLWPYDEGGCACPKCYPWGANGFLDISQKIGKIARRFYPQMKIVLSTWTYDTPEEGEWEGLSQRLAEKNDWVDYILADSHGEFPQYPLVHGVPGNLPLINFPEISMWGLSPWGGYGANPLPSRFTNLWKQIKHIAVGGFPYSEGLFEDINKVLVSQFYWEPDAKTEDILSEYISYEYAHTVLPDALKMISLIESNHTRVADGEKPNLKDSVNAYFLAESIQQKLPENRKNNWRWRILFLRALLDRERYQSAKEEEYPWFSYRSWGDVLQGNPVAEDAMRELIDLYHAKIVDDGTYVEHSWLRPPLKS